MRAGDVVARLTLVTLDCRPFDIAMSVSEVRAAVYSPTVLRLRDQSLVRFETISVIRATTARRRRRVSSWDAGARSA